MKRAWQGALLAAALLTGLTCASERPGRGLGTDQPATVVSRTGRWFTIDGRHSYLVGVDIQELVADPKIDYAYVFDRLQSYGINKVRIWIYSYWGGSRYLHPWKYSIVWQKFDLDSWNPVFWSRLRNAVASAEKHGIVVEVSIFGPNNVASAAQWSNSKRRNAWNKAFNSNGAFTANHHGDFVPQFFELDYPEKSSTGKTLRGYQRALVDKTIKEIGAFPNVYFEVANEFPVVFDSASDAIDRLYPWQLHWAERLKDESGHLIAVHSHQGSGPQTHGVQYFWNKPYIDILNFHFYSPDPAEISRLLHASQSRGKILECNESFEVPANLDKATREAWGWFLSGGYYSFYTSVKLVGQKQWLPVARRAEALRKVAEKLPFWEMAPVDKSGNEYDSLVKHGPTTGRWQVLADPGSDYVVFFWGKHGEESVSMHLPPGDYTFAWYDPRNAAVLLKGSFGVGKGLASVPAPQGKSWNSNLGVALVIRRSQEQRFMVPIRGRTGSVTRGTTATGQAGPKAVAE